MNLLIIHVVFWFRIVQFAYSIHLLVNLLISMIEVGGVTNWDVNRTRDRNMILSLLISHTRSLLPRMRKSAHHSRCSVNKNKFNRYLETIYHLQFTRSTFSRIHHLVKKASPHVVDRSRNPFSCRSTFSLFASVLLTWECWKWKSQPETWDFILFL